MTDTATWLQFTKDELYTLQYHMLAGTTPEALAMRQKIQERLEDMNNPAQVDLWNQFRNAVNTGDNLNVDGDAVISESDEGAWVMSWSWVTNDQAGIEETVDDEEDASDED